MQHNNNLIKKNNLNHLAIIPDGNRRWAKKKNLFSWQGHEKGGDRIKELTKFVFEETSIDFLTFWIASNDNLKKRARKELVFLFYLFDQAFKELIKNIKSKKQNVKIQIIGNWKKQAPDYLQKTICQVHKLSEKFSKKNLVFLLAYDGISEMETAIKKIASRKLPPKLNYETIKSFLSTSELPPVNFVIRTGGEPHNSAGFLMWHTVYSQYYFTKTYFPDFDVNELKKALDEYYQRQRRFGS